MFVPRTKPQPSKADFAPTWLNVAKILFQKALQQSKIDLISGSLTFILELIFPALTNCFLL